METVASVNPAAMTSAIEAGLAAEASGSYTVAVTSVTEPVITQAAENSTSSDASTKTQGAPDSSDAFDEDQAASAAVRCGLPAAWALALALLWRCAGPGEA